MLVDIGYLLLKWLFVRMYLKRCPLFKTSGTHFYDEPKKEG